MNQSKDARSEEKPVGKYGAMIQKARNLENQNSSSSDEILNQESPTRFADDTQNQLTGNPESQQASQEQKEEEVNLSIKVAKRLRRHWVAEAKRRDTSLTAIIINYLKETLGEPLDT